MKAQLKIIFLILALAGGAVDLFTKYIAFRLVGERGTATIVSGFFDIAPTRNAGAAFGLFHGHYTFFIIVSIAALFTILLIAEISIMLKQIGTGPKDGGK